MAETGAYALQSSEVDASSKTRNVNYRLIGLAVLFAFSLVVDHVWAGNANLLATARLLAGMVVGLLVVATTLAVVQPAAMRIELHRTAVLAVGLASIFVVAAIAGYKYDLLFGKWNILLGLGAIFICIVAHTAPSVRTPRGVATIMVGLAGVVCASALTTRGFMTSGSTTFATYIVLSIPWIGLGLLLGQQGVTFSGKSATEISSKAILVLWSLVSVASLATIPSTMALAEAFSARPGQTGFWLGLGTVLAWAIVSSLGRKTRKKQYPSLALRALGVLPYLVLLFFASRSDAPFYEPFGHHWEFFVGPVRSVKNGAWLLYDAPAQYGFLSTLIPAMIPVTSASQAFYIFQCGVLFVSSAAFYRTLTTYCGVPQLLAILFVALAFFLATPGAIGPAVHPSTSGVRFVFVYLLLYHSTRTLRSAHDLRGYVVHGTPIWILSTLWSAESAIYGTTMFFSAPLLAIAQSALGGATMFGTAGLIRQFSLTILAPIGALILALGVVLVVYLSQLGQWPDVNMFLMYGSAYSAGFGGMPIAGGGPIWLFVSIMAAAGSAAFLALHRRQPAFGPLGVVIVAMTATWAVSSYFVGRAAPQNALNLLPILCLSLCLVLRSATHLGSTSAVGILVAVPLFSLALAAPSVDPMLVPVLLRTSQLDMQVDSERPEADAELSAVLGEARITLSSPVVYLGTSAAMPRPSGGGTYNTTWLPNPLQMLDEPIDERTRQEIIGRYVRRLSHGGYLVYEKGTYDIRLPRWIQLLSSYLRLKAEWHSEHYSVYHFLSGSVGWTAQSP